MKKDKEDNDKDDDKEDDDKEDDDKDDDNQESRRCDISYDGNMSCDGETPNHINSNSTWIFLRVVVTVATYFFSETIS